MVEGEVPVANSGARRFAAFISYSHADAAIAGKLQRKLERYRLPKHIARSRAGQAAEIGLVFRDREDLAAAPSLSDAIRDALSQAETLIVICSPDARGSRWVGEEIALFRELHPDRPVLAALVRGEPDDAFPAALSEGGIEPLAADLRKEGDGEALGFLKIVAGVAGVPLDALVQRDAQRRVRRVTWITLGALAAMLVMGVMTSFAIQARNEAARQRASAEGLVEFMITDLGEKLDGVGRLDVMDSVNARAMRHYDDQSPDALQPESLGRRARILHALGEIEIKRGNFSAASKSLSLAAGISVNLIAAYPSDAEHRFTHGQSAYWLGRVAIHEDKYATARKHWNAYLRQSRILSQLEPQSPRGLLETGYAHGNLCELEFDETGNAQKAEQDCARSLQLVQKAARLDATNMKTVLALANRQGWMADIFEAQGKLKEAISQRRAEVETVERLIARDPLNLEYVERANLPAIGLVSLYLDKNDVPAAEAVLMPAIARIEAAIKRADDNPGPWIERLRLAYYHTEIDRRRNRNWRARAAESWELAQRVEARFGSGLRQRTTAFDAIKRQSGV
jgi:tetratricopeptide (TPR) repeat protein